MAHYFIKDILLVGLVLAICTERIVGHRFRLHGRSRHLVKRQIIEPLPCSNNEQYSRLDGSCNNVNNPTWGMAGAPLKRWNYKENQSTPRTKDSEGGDLPTAREVSLAYHEPNEDTADVTLMLMQFGQFLDHDITLTPEVHLEGVDCCPEDLSTANEDCISIPLKNDPYFSPLTCMPLTRSTFTQDTETGTQEQSNALTSFIDGSQIYGSSEDELSLVRDFSNDGTLLITDLGAKGSYLPEGAAASCSPDNTAEYCFLAGDVRVNEQPGLAAMHTIFMRQHNRVATALGDLNRHWDGERIFQETRKIIGAILQRIVYSEFHPIVLGTGNLRLRQLETYSYNRHVQPNIFNVFATAAYRFGHSLIPEVLTVNNEALLFKNMFFSPSLVINSLNDLSATLKDQAAMGADRSFSHSITRHLFETPGVARSGFDLVARNIQRGRDHNIPTYNEMRRNCSLPVVRNLRELFPDVERASHVYKSIDDVDMFTGGMSETNVRDGLVGPLFACIINEQFNRLRDGDRFFYEHKGQSTSFTDEQIAEIEKMTLAKVICENTENKNVQPNIFKPVNQNSNPTTECSRISDINLDLWIEDNNGGGNNNDGNRNDGNRNDGNRNDGNRNDGNDNNNPRNRPGPENVPRPPAPQPQPRDIPSNGPNNGQNDGNNRNNERNNNNNRRG